MTHSEQRHDPEASPSTPAEPPQSLPVKAWVTLILFAGFVTAFGSCASLFMFD